MKAPRNLPLGPHFLGPHDQKPVAVRSDGLNPTPCILAYTSAELAQRRSTEVVASIGGTAAVMAVPVADAVRWMVSGDLGVGWASFNHGEGSENFPLYFFQVEELAIAFGVLPKS